jgi:enoyl-CoA hydratase
MLISGKMIDANTALQYGLVNYVVPPDTLLEKARSILQLVNTKAPLAIAACIASVNAFYDPSMAGYEREIDAFAQCFATEDMKEGTTAFLEKRKAMFKGR